jgi:signal transduction histidine kinase
LANGFRHAAGAGQRVELKLGDHGMEVVISDNGPGFDPQAAIREGHLGLLGMRERVEVLGGTFDVQSRPMQGTVIRVTLPLLVPEMNYE